MLFLNNTKIILSFVYMFAVFQMIGLFYIWGIPTDSGYPPKCHNDLVFEHWYPFKDGGCRFSVKGQEARLPARYAIKVSVSEPLKKFPDLY